MPKSRYSRSTSKKVNKLARQVSTLIKAPERKAHDILFNNNIGTTPNMWWFMEGLSIGTDVDQRIGEKVTLKSLRLRVTLTSADVYNDVRVMIFRLRPTGTSLSDYVDNLLQNPTDPFNSFLKRNGTIKYRLIYDKRILMGGRLGNNNGGTASTIAQVKPLLINVPVPKGGLSTHFTPSNTIAGTCESYMMLIFSDSGVTPYPVISGYARCVYTDA